MTMFMAMLCVRGERVSAILLALPIHSRNANPVKRLG